MQIRAVALLMLLAGAFVQSAAAVDEVRSASDIDPDYQPLPPPSTPPTCTVKVCCHPVAFQTAQHCYTKCIETGSNGKKLITACRGGPARDGPFKKVKPPNKRPHCPDLSIFEAPLGAIDAYCGVWDKTHPDFKKRKKAVCSSVPNSSCAACDCIADVYYSIEQCCAEYQMIDENSNSAVYTALTRCFIQDASLPLDDEWVPGWNEDVLTNNNCQQLDAPPGWVSQPPASP